MKKLTITSIIIIIFGVIVTHAANPIGNPLQQPKGTQTIQSATLRLNGTGSLESVVDIETITSVSLVVLQAQQKTLTNQIATLQSQLDTLNQQIVTAQNVLQSGKSADLLAK